MVRPVKSQVEARNMLLKMRTCKKQGYPAEPRGWQAGCMDSCGDSVTQEDSPQAVLEPDVRASPG